MPIVLIVISGLAAFFLLSKPVSTAVNVPVYGGAVENTTAETQLRQQLESVLTTNSDVKAYESTDNSSTVTSWYSSQVSQFGLTKENEKSEQYFSLFLLKQGNSGAIVAVVAVTSGRTSITVVTDSWGNVNSVWNLLNTLSDAVFADVYVPSTRTIAGSASGTVYDSDPTSAESYNNENIVITFGTTVGNLRYVGNADSGLTVTLSSLSAGRDWGPFMADVKGQTNYGSGYVEENGYWTVGSGKTIWWRLYVPVTSTGTLGEGQTSYLYLKTDTDTTYDTDTGAGNKPATTLWDEDDDLTISISSYGDTFTTSFGTIRLFGSNWITTESSTTSEDNIPAAELVAGTASATVYDSDPTSAESYNNENILITFSTTTGYLRYVGDTGQGLTVTISNPRTGWGPFIVDVKGQTDYSNEHVIENGIWTASGNNVFWKLYVPVTADGKFESGATAYLYLYTYGPIDSRLPVTKPSATLWDHDDDLTFSVSCYGDTFTTSFGTVRLFGSNWIQ
ncbi:MAG: hypothetical protein AB1476_06435 [Candidatus Hadarchaeota archaeon]